MYIFNGIYFNYLKKSTMNEQEIIDIRRKQEEYNTKCRQYYQACIDKDGDIINTLRKDGFNPSHLKDLRSGQFTRFHNDEWAKRQMGLSTVLSVLNNVLIPDLTDIVLDYCKNSKGELFFASPPPSPKSPQYPSWYRRFERPLSPPSYYDQSSSSDSESPDCEISVAVSSEYIASAPLEEQEEEDLSENEKPAPEPSAPVEEEEEEERGEKEMSSDSEDEIPEPEPSSPTSKKKKKCCIQ